MWCGVVVGWGGNTINNYLQYEAIKERCLIYSTAF